MPLHLNPLSKTPPDPTTKESDVYLLPAISAIHLSAFLTTALHQVIYCGPVSTHPGIIEAYIQRHRRALLEDPTYRITSCIGCHEPEVGEEWNVVGFVKYKIVEGKQQEAMNGVGRVGGGDEANEQGVIGEVVAPPPPPPPPTPAEKRMWPEGTHVSMVNWFWPRLLDFRERYDKRLGNYIFVDTLATDPSWHRMGVGKLLMDEVCEEADRRGCAAWVESSQEGRKLYEKMGFVGQEELWTDLGRWDGGMDKGECWRGEGAKEGEGQGWYLLLMMVRPARKRTD